MADPTSSKGLTRWLNAGTLLKIVAFSMACYHLYKSYFGVYEVWRHRGIHLIFVIALSFLYKGLAQEGRSKILKIYDGILLLLALGIGVYIAWDYEEIALRAGVPDLLDMASCIILAFLVVSAAMRILGLPMTSVTLFFIFYVLFGSYLPGAFSHTGVSYTRLVDHFFNSSNGILGIPTGASAVYVAIFIYFATFLLKSGAAEFFKDLSLALAGSRVGGPAKVAIVASAFVGTMMGSAVANVATTGSFTIPMMIRIGYRKHFAGAVEAVASTGGQIMPPIMASVIFIISEYTGIPFYKLIVNAIVPAVMYFFCLYLMVHFEARKIYLPTIPKSELPSLREVLRKGPWFLLLPIPVLVIFLFVGYSPFYSAFLSILAILICASFSAKTRMGPRRIMEAMIEGSINCLVIGVACGAASIIVGSIEITGMGLRFSSLMIQLSGGSLWVLLVLAMIASLILGMGMTTVSAYIIVAVLTVPALIHLGVNELAAHFFCFYFAILNAITPPVALAAFTGAGIAKANEMKTALTAMKLGIAGCIVPYLFIYDPSFLLIGPADKIIPHLLMGFSGVWALAASIQGFLLRPLSLLGRGALLFAAIVIFWPTAWYMSFMGFLIFGGYLLGQRISIKKSLEAAK
jgi:TRAP transporter 4TM/12TM fusion protein